MKRHIINIALILMVCVTIFSCKKELVPLFDERAGIYFKDTLWSYTFIDFPGKTLDTIKIPTELFGKSTPYDRTFKVSLITDDTLRVSDLDENSYKILDCILPADSLKAVVPIEVKYSDKMDEDVFTLFLKIDANEEFPNVAYNARKMRFQVTNKLIQPTNWNYPLQYYFGMTYSTGWYKFILKVFNKGYVPYFPGYDPERYYMGEEEFFAYVALVKAELEKYNNAHPEDHLKHDDGPKKGQEVQM